MQIGSVNIVTEADLSMESLILNTAYNKYIDIVKTGARTLILKACGLNNYQCFLVKEGTLFLNAALKATGPKMKIDGGTVVGAEGKASVVPELLLGAGGTLEVQPNASFTFNALGDGWDVESDPVLIKYADKDTSSVILPTLTAQQRSHLKIQVADDKVCTVMQDAKGRLLPAPKGLLLIFR